ncbi:transglutaminase domain-containing protein [Flavobacterium lacus]|uniref:Transglutaminase superfamily protein n=1 Tax=Flavobacterium lacus TaxID=1353778 RepID=A0A328WVM4_9FLAO|nr:transglutaminase domain-containing protein [Flavobacterium lacus]RAR47348.1 transglutaminase superfamily protein [Flavobacterium lacus]
MNLFGTLKYQELKTKFQVKKPWDDVIIFVLNVLIAIPVFIILHQNLKDPEWYFNIDRILIAIILLIIIQLILRLIRTILILGIATYFIILIYGTVFSGYGFESVFQDYGYMIYSMSENPNPQDLMISKLLPFPNKTQILNAIEYDHPQVRNFALTATTLHFKEIKGQQEHRKMIQCFAVFKEIRNRWNYVNDPKGQEYIAHATESLIHFSGDCDDHAILMAACIRAIGGTPRLIHTGGHIYPEMLVGKKSDLEAAVYLIKELLFVSESKNKEIHYHIDERGQIWLNLDYTARYPGGPFMSEEILGALTLN